jgi:hypothetical protein
MNLVLQNICSNRDNQQNEELIENNELFLRFLPLLLAYYKICHSQIQCRYNLSTTVLRSYLLTHISMMVVNLAT